MSKRKETQKHSEYMSCKRKTRYRTSGEAQHMCSRIFKSTGKQMDYYYCDFCRGYHLTSRLDFMWNGKKSDEIFGGRI